MTTTTLQQQIGQRIRALRKQRKLTAATVAAALGWPYDTLINYEYGRRQIPFAQLEQLAQHFAVPPAALLVADEATANLITRLTTDAELAREVQFFVDTLEAAPMAEPRDGA